MSRKTRSSINIDEYLLLRRSVKLEGSNPRRVWFFFLKNLNNFEGECPKFVLYLVYWEKKWFTRAPWQIAPLRLSDRMMLNRSLFIFVSLFWRTNAWRDGIVQYISPQNELLREMLWTEKRETLFIFRGTGHIKEYLCRSICFE